MIFEMVVFHIIMIAFAEESSVQFVHANWTLHKHVTLLCITICSCTKLRFFLSRPFGPTKASHRQAYRQAIRQAMCLPNPPPPVQLRLQREVAGLVPKGTPVKVVALPERQYAAWLGGSLLASLHTFPCMWISKLEYDEYGPRRPLVAAGGGEVGHRGRVAVCLPCHGFPERQTTTTTPAAAAAAAAIIAPTWRGNPGEFLQKTPVLAQLPALTTLLPHAAAFMVPFQSDVVAWIPHHPPEVLMPRSGFAPKTLLCCAQHPGVCQAVKQKGRPIPHPFVCVRRFLRVAMLCVCFCTPPLPLFGPMPD